MATKQTKYFVVRHDLASLEALPNYVWRTGLGRHKTPHGYKGLTVGSKWVSYAYTKNDYSSDRLRYVTGFYSCIRPCQFGPIPLSPSDLRELSLRASSAWLIKGAPDRKGLQHPVLVPSINYFFDTKKYNAVAITPITQKEYERIHEYVLDHQLPPAEVPLLKREPKSEQEVLAIFLKAHESLGVKRILRVQQRFPDVEVELAGKSGPVKIELELYSQSYINHGHRKDRNVAVLCWLNDDPRGEGKKVKDWVHKVYELRELLQHKQKIVW